MKPARRFTDGEAREAAKLAARCLEVDLRVQLVYLFGSAADSKCTDVRDADLAILTAPPFSLDEILRLRADAVAAARLPIDLVSLNHASVVLAKEVADTGLCLFARSPDIWLAANEF
jgi:predicted nucleotidyltransferase